MDGDGSRHLVPVQHLHVFRQIDHALAEGAVHGRPAGALAGPVEVLDRQRVDVAGQQPQVNRPGQTPFYHRVTNVELHADPARIQVMEQIVQIPERGADVARAGMVLDRRCQAVLAAQGRQIAKARLDLVKLGRDGVGVVVLVDTETVCSTE